MYSFSLVFPHRNAVEMSAAHTSSPFIAPTANASLTVFIPTTPAYTSSMGGLVMIVKVKIVLQSLGNDLFVVLDDHLQYLFNVRAPCRSLGGFGMALLVTEWMF